MLLSPIERELRIAAVHAPYHAAVSDEIAVRRPDMLISVHSFTPARATFPDEKRPWPIGILYNQDERAARIAIAWLRDQGVQVGDNEPYSGRALNYTMDRHAEMAAIPYIGLEIRQDGLCGPDEIACWANLLARLVTETHRVLARKYQ